MPRKKIETDIVLTVHQYFARGDLAEVGAVLRIEQDVVRRRQAQGGRPTESLPAPRRQPAPPATPPLSPVPDGAQAAIPALPGVPVVKVKRKRRTQAEMTQGLPVVPLQASVGDDDQNQNDQE